MKPDDAEQYRSHFNCAMSAHAAIKEVVCVIRAGVQSRVVEIATRKKLEAEGDARRALEELAAAQHAGDQGRGKHAEMAYADAKQRKKAMTISMIQTAQLNASFFSGTMAYEMAYGTALQENRTMESFRAVIGRQAKHGIGSMNEASNAHTSDGNRRDSMALTEAFQDFRAIFKVLVSQAQASRTKLWQ